MVPVELGILIVLVLLLGAGAIETLRQIRDAIQENYQASLARAMTTMDVAVTPEKEKVVQACRCGHPKSVHWVNPVKPDNEGTGPCHGSVYPNGKQPARPCDCEQFRPARGPWPGEVKV
jgi:hypothetical protein